MKTGASGSAAQPLLEAPSFTRRLLLRGAAAYAATSFLPEVGVFGQAAPLPAYASNPQPTPMGSLTSASLTVTSDNAGFIGPRFTGLSYPKNLLSRRFFTASNQNLIALFNHLGPAVLRVGGNHVDTTVWAPNGAGQTEGQIAPSDVDVFAAFFKATGWQCIYSVNLGGSATGATNPTLAAEEVAYVQQKMGSSVLGFVIGNEPGNYGGKGHVYAGNWSLSKFENLWKQYRNVIVAKTPNAPIMGPSMALFKQLDNWTLPFARNIGKRGIVTLTQHYYRGGSEDASIEAMIKPDPQLVHGLAELKSCSQQIGVPFRLTECNSYFGYNIEKVIYSYASSLWVIDFLFQCAMGGCVGVNIHSTPGGGGYAPIAFSKQDTVYAAHPEYYGMLLFQLAGQGTIYKTQLKAGDLNATAYAVRTSSGALNVVVNNKDPKNNLDLTIKLPYAARSATLLEMTQRSPGAAVPDLQATDDITLQSAKVNADGSFSPAPAYTLSPRDGQITCYCPALSAVLLKIA